MPEDRKLQPAKQVSDLAADTSVFTAYLEQFGLPTENVIATTKERGIVGSNLPTFLDDLPAEEKRDARYLSKFVGATAVGLFDAALNYIWNEVVLNLRKKADVYGIDLFFDAAVGGTLRASYKDATDLDGIKDTVLLNTCLKLELVSEVVFRKLDHILTMRNEVAASHPNVERIGGFELLGWLQTCVKDVLQDRPSESAIRIKSLIDNVKSRKDVIDEATRLRFQAELKNLSLPHVQNLLITLFGLYVSPTTDQILRANIAKISPSVWKFAGDRVRLSIGATIDGYRTNLQQTKLEQGVEFLTHVDGRMYETLPAKTIQLTNLAELLDQAHEGWDNFHHEPPVMQQILQFCRKSTDIPKDVLPALTRVILRCRIGRGLSYREGVSPVGLPLYDQFLGMLDDKGIVHCIAALFQARINAKLNNPTCQKHLGSILSTLATIAVADRLKQIIAYLRKDVSVAHTASSRKEFKELCAPYITFK
jgi:hypothetical protein